MDSYEFFSSSLDSTIKLWDAEQKGLIETLRGHRFGVHSIDILTEDKLVSVGYDRVPIVWKIEKNSHMVYKQLDSSINTVNCIN